MDINGDRTHEEEKPNEETPLLHQWNGIIEKSNKASQRAAVHSASVN